MNLSAKARSQDTGKWTLLLAAALFLTRPAIAHAGPSRAFAWGDNSYGQTNVPAAVTNATTVAAGYYHGMALRSNGTVVVWGDNSFGQTNNQPGLTNIIAIDGGEYHCLALRGNGTVYAWGANNYGQLNWPAGLSNVIAISAGRNHSMALRNNGTVAVWGNNSQTQTNVPPGATNVVAISAGDAHCLALRNNGTVIGWGDDGSGQSTVPVTVTNIKAIAAGYHHNLAIRSNGTVVAWGVNVYGEATVPANLSNVIAVAAGYFHSAALTSDGRVVAWGQEFSGVTNVPVGLNSVTALAAGWEFDLALSSSGLCPPGFPDNFECRPPLTGSSVSNVISNLGATREPGEPLPGGILCSNSIWYSWTAPASGGVVVQVAGDFDFASPLLAIYSGNSLATLTNVAFNFAPFTGSGSPLNKARVVFTAVQGRTYQIAVDGVPTPFFENQGSLTFTLALTPPPANDLFQNATVIPGIYYEQTNGTFAGANREANEPTHDTSYAQTLWWDWTAPTNLNAATVPMRLTADAVSFPPVIRVYTGGSIGALTPVTLNQSTDGMTQTATFSAAPNVTYHIALAGLENDTNTVLPLVGNLRFRLNTRALALSILNVVSNVTSTQAVTFTATGRVENLGSATSGPMRVRTTAVPGISMRGGFTSSITSTNVPLDTWFVPALAPGQFTNLPLSGIAPAPTESLPGISSAEGYGVYAELQEQAGTNWTAVDQALVLYGVWPDLNGLPGPGGGVIRLDPGYVGTSAFNPLAAVTVVGAPTVVEGNSESYYGQARYANNFLFNFTNTTWLASRFNLTTNGVYSPGIVASNTPVSLTAKFSSSGFTYDANTNITVINLPSPTLDQLQRTGTNFIFRVNARSHRRQG